MKSVSGWKVPSPSSWSRRAISLDKGREIWKCFVSTKFPSQHSCSARTLLSPWERDAKYIPTRSTRFNRAFPSHNGFQIFCCAGSCFEWLNLSEPCSGSTLLQLLHSYTDAFQRQTLTLESWTGHSRVGPSQAQVGFAPGLFGEEWMSHTGCTFWPSCFSSSWILPF